MSVLQTVRCNHPPPLALAHHSCRQLKKAGSADEDGAGGEDSAEDRLGYISPVLANVMNRPGPNSHTMPSPPASPPTPPPGKPTPIFRRAMSGGELVNIPSPEAAPHVCMQSNHTGTMPAPPARSTNRASKTGRRRIVPTVRAPPTRSTKRASHKGRRRSVDSVKAAPSKMDRSSTGNRNGTMPLSANPFRRRSSVDCNAPENGIQFPSSTKSKRSRRGSLHKNHSTGEWA